MELNLGLYALGIFGSYFIRITAAYLVCVVLAQLLRRPQFRFTLWFSFLSGAGIYWLFLLAQMVGTLGTFPIKNVPGSAATSAAAAGSARLMNWGLPANWGGHITALVAALPWAYAAGLVLLLLVTARKRLHLRRILRRSISVSSRLERILDELCDELRIRRCRIMVLNGLTSPATAYSFRPRILVPEALELYLNQAQLRDVLCHELMHVKRRDYFWGSVSDLVRCLLFFHPATWLALRHLNRERELACDDAVVRHLHDRRPDYAECLTRLARVQLAEERTSVALNFATSGSFLSLRVRMLLAETQHRPLWQSGLALMAGLALLAGFAGLCPTLAIVLHYVPALVTSMAQSESRPQNLPVRERSGRHLRPAVSTKATVHPPNLVGAEPELDAENEQEAKPEMGAERETLLPPPPALVLPRAKSLNEDFTPQPQASASTESPAAASHTDRPAPTSNEVPPPRTKRRSGILPGWHKTAAMAAIALGRVALGGGGGQQGENFTGSPKRY